MLEKWRGGGREMQRLREIVCEERERRDMHSNV
jgi:hypothetical protein